MFDLYEHIDNLRKESGFKNMTALCVAAGVPRSVMSELRSGRSKDLSKPNGMKFAETLGVSLDVIYGTEEKPATPKSDGLTEDDIKLALSKMA